MHYSYQRIYIKAEGYAAHFNFVGKLDVIHNLLYENRGVFMKETKIGEVVMSFYTFAQQEPIYNKQ